MRIIPAIDIIDGKCVRLSQGDYDQKKVYHENPLDAARSFEDAGLSYLHLVDLDGAKAGKVTNWKVIESITRQTTLTVDFGGGVKSEEEIKSLLELGVRQVNLGSIAVKDPEKVNRWIADFGSGSIILSADVKKEQIAISGWQENSDLNIMSFLKDYQARGIHYVTCTDIGTDGMLSGPNFELYKRLTAEFPSLKIIASGGISSIEDLDKLKKIGMEGAVIGKAIYEKRITLRELASL